MAFMHVAECIEQLIAAANEAPKPSIEHVDLLSATGRTLAQDIVSKVNVPPADNSAMDGYAFNTQQLTSQAGQSETAPGLCLAISQRIQAGDSPAPLKPGSAARIFTGAEIPAGADCVIIQENCQTRADNSDIHPHHVKLLKNGQSGDNIRRRGQDITSGTTVLRQGLRLRPQDIGLLASIGVAQIPVYRPLTIGIINTGNELIEPGTELSSGQIYNSNRFLVDAICTEWGFKTKHIDIVTDSLEATKSAFTELAQRVDVIISTGGVSVGEEDHVKPAITALGALDLWKVAIKPGKPFAFGHIDNRHSSSSSAHSPTSRTHKTDTNSSSSLSNTEHTTHNSTRFIGLPGNPASTFVTLLILARPYLLIRQGRALHDVQTRYVMATATFNKKPAQRDEYIRARSINNAVTLDNSTTQATLKNPIEIYPNQSSGVLFSASWGDCFALQAAGQTIYPNDLIPSLLYSDLLR